MVFGVAGILLGLVAFTGPWWTFSYQSVGPMWGAQTATYGLFGRTVSPMYTPASPSGTYVSDYDTLPNTAALFLIGAVLSASGVLAASGLTVLASMRTSRPRRWREALAIGSFLLTLAAPLSVMARLPDTLTQDMGPDVSGFWGSATRSVGTSRVYESWGAGWAWYAVVAAALLFLIAALFFLRGREESADEVTLPPT